MARSLELARLLECVAISEALSGVLLVGASASMLDILCDRLRVLLKAAGSSKVDQVRLGADATEQALWGAAGVPAQWGARALMMPSPGTTRLVIVPDLSRLSHPAARAAVFLLEGREIPRQHARRTTALRPHQRWIAGIAERDLHNVSPHLLERFSIRVRIEEQLGGDRIAALQARLSGATATLVVPASIERVRGAIDTSRIDPAVMSLAITLCKSAGESASMRPAISLLRVAQAWARLARSAQVSQALLIESARALGLEMSSALTSSIASSANPAVTNASKDPQETPAALAAGKRAVGGKTQQPARARRGDAWAAKDLQYESGEVIAAQAPAIGVAPAPQVLIAPETLPTPTEFTTLRLPWRQARATQSGKGTIIGAQRMESVRDLAIFDTVLAALPHQRQRRRARPSIGSGLVIYRSDLRSCRRLPIVTEQLILVLDYTSVQRRRWQKAILPFLADAYASRAELCIIKVGAQKTRNEARAERMVARSVLVPSVAEACRESAGRATPLADGLTQALRVIKQTMGHGRASARSTTLVVVSDGRGNVPLAASRQGRLAAQVGLQGIEDAKRVAREISVLPNVRRYFVNPEPDWMKELPFVLASHLGAKVVKLDGTQ